jgi:hypothetical protein
MYEITIYPNTIAPWFSQVYAGLFDLQQSGKARVSISTQFDRSELMDAKSLALDVKELRSNKNISILIDLNDNRNFALPDAIDWFDVIVKRSYYQPEIDKLPERMRNKIIPYGINYNCGSASIPIVQLFTYHHLLRLRLLGGPKTNRYKPWFSMQHQLRFLFYLGRNNLSLHEPDFMATPDWPTKYSIFFITRLFKSGQGLTEFSWQRIELVKALKKEFGSRFHGGIVRTELAERHCPKELLFTKISRRQFTKTLKESDIAVCTLGVGQSNPWKLGEAMAAARCIVSEPLLFKLPTPLQEEINIKTFNTVDDCLAACEELVRNPRLIKQMKENNRDYYQQYIKAERLLERVLVDSFRNNEYGDVTISPSEEQVTEEVLA